MTAPLSTQDPALSTPPATDHGPRTTDSARAAANRLNAQKSTGPRTAAGKAKAALNALKHGLTSQSPLLPTEDPTEYQTFAEGYLEELDPKTVEQFNLAQQLITVSWKLNRIPQIEAKVLAEHANRHPLMIQWRKDCAAVEYENTLRRHPKPLPEKPVIPTTTADDLIAESFFPKPPTPGAATTGEPLGAALHRLRQYHTQLLNTYLKLLKKYENSQNEPTDPATGNQQLATTPENEPTDPIELSTQDSAPSTSPSATTPENEPTDLATGNDQLATNPQNEANPTADHQPEIANPKSQIANSPASPLSTINHQLSTTPKIEPNSPSLRTQDLGLSTQSSSPNPRPQPSHCNFCGTTHHPGRCPRDPFGRRL